jgi:hypothetical protein
VRNKFSSPQTLALEAAHLIFTFTDRVIALTRKVTMEEEPAASELGRVEYWIQFSGMRSAGRDLSKTKDLSTALYRLNIPGIP